MIKRDNYINISGWMVTDLKLKGNELLIYAIIYGFSQDGESRFTGSLRYLSEWTNSTKQGVQNCLKSLCEKGLIHKVGIVKNGVKFCEYHTTKFDTVYNKVAQGIQQSCIGGIQQSCHNNIDSYIQDNNLYKNIDTEILRRIEAIENESLRRAYLDFALMRSKKKKPLTVKALERLFKRVEQLEKDTEKQVQIIQNATDNYWLTVYAEKGEENASDRNDCKTGDWGSIGQTL